VQLGNRLRGSKSQAIARISWIVTWLAERQIVIRHRRNSWQGGFRRHWRDGQKQSNRRQQEQEILGFHKLHYTRQERLCQFGWRQKLCKNLQ